MLHVTPSTFWSYFDVGELLSNPKAGLVLRDDFTTTMDTALTWTSAVTGTNSTVSALGGVLRMDTGGTITNQNSLIDKVPVCKLATGKRVAFEAVVNVNDASLSAFFVGLASSVMSDTDCRPADGIGFTKLAGATAINVVHSVGGVDTVLASVGTLAASTDTLLGFIWDGNTKAEFFINGVSVGKLTISSPTAVLLARCLMGRNGSGAARRFEFDWVQVAQER